MSKKIDDLLFKYPKPSPGPNAGKVLAWFFAAFFVVCLLSLA